MSGTMMYTMSDLITEVKEDIGLTDLPRPTLDTKLAERIKKVDLRDFSIRCPHRVDFLLTDNDRIKTDPANTPGIRYRIPPSVYSGSKVLMLIKLDIQKPNGYSDMYIPQGLYLAPDQIMEAIGNIRVAASSAASMAKAPTTNFAKPDIITVFNGWSGGVYDVTIGLQHDDSLSTIPDTAITDFKDLVELDIKAYLYGMLKRKDNLDLGIGNIDLKIEDWADAAREKRDLIRDWDDYANLDIDSIQYF